MCTCKMFRYLDAQASLWWLSVFFKGSNCQTIQLSRLVWQKMKLRRSIVCPVNFMVHVLHYPFFELHKTDFKQTYPNIREISCPMLNRSSMNPTLFRTSQAHMVFRKRGMAIAAHPNLTRPPLCFVYSRSAVELSFKSGNVL
ncbi:hypothetical protein DFH29DRAFT_938191 [Suillus ampliporus]|nr:hypothetical protein DFH29DRAFT_938191 [Suillus ampliporus]